MHGETIKFSSGLVLTYYGLTWKSGVPDLGHDVAVLTEFFRVFSQSPQGYTTILIEVRRDSFHSYTVLSAHLTSHHSVPLHIVRKFIQCNELTVAPLRNMRWFYHSVGTRWRSWLRYSSCGTSWHSRRNQISSFPETDESV